jgi:CheY-like chemotaxis protein/HPt (histidine-containing phosphotransfer) domain-containing protein
LEKQLQRLGAGVVTADAVPAAVARLRATPDFAAVLVDARLPAPGAAGLAEALGANPALSTVPLILLAPAGAQPASRARWATVITKPVTRANLLAGLERVWRTARGVEAPPAEALLAPSSSPLRILLVEDNPANQIVGRMLLEKLGHTVDLAPSGAAALESFVPGKKFDLVLMDCQLPGLDGYEATRRIRTGAVPGADPLVPIIALTAYAMPQDREKCLAAGMDDYLSKPIDPAELSAAMARCVPALATPPAAGEEIFEHQTVAILRDLPGRHGPSLWPEMIALFSQQETDWLVELARVATAQDGPELSRIAHRLAGACASIGARQMRTAALAVEHAANATDWQEVARALVTLRQTSVRLRNALESAPVSPP